MKIMISTPGPGVARGMGRGLESGFHVWGERAREDYIARSGDETLETAERRSTSFFLPTPVSPYFVHPLGLALRQSATVGCDEDRQRPPAATPPPPPPLPRPLSRNRDSGGEAEAEDALVGGNL
jgi:hypothetical protein